MRRFKLMYALWLAAALLAGLILILSLASAQALPEEPASSDVVADAPGAIEGYLYEPDGTTPVEDGWIHIEDLEGQPWMGTNTDPVGHFEILNLSPGGYILRAFPPEGSPDAASLPQEVEVLSGQWASTTLLLTEVGISGYVRDCDAMPEERIPGAWVVAHNADWSFAVDDSTNISGEFKLGGLEIGTPYILEAHPPHESEYVPLEPIEVTPISTSVVLELCIPPINVQGVVNDPNGDPVDGAWVTIWNEFFWDETGAEMGNFHFRGLPLDGGNEYWIHAGPPWGSVGLISSEPFSISVPTPPLSATVVMTLPQAFKTVTGHVVIAGTSTGVPDAEVVAHRLDGPGFAGTPVDATGAYTLSLTGGEWHLLVQPSVPPVEWVWPGPPAWVVFDQDTTPQAEVADFEVLPTDASVGGQILCPGGTVGAPCPSPGDPPPEAIHVELRNDEIGNGAPLMPGYDFEIPIPSGWYELVVHVDHPMFQGPEPILLFVEPGGPLVLPEPIMLWHKDAHIQGTVRNEYGLGVAGVSIFAWQPEGFGWGWAETDANGGYDLPVVGGEWFVEPHPGPDLPYVYNQMPELVRVLPASTMFGVDFVLSDGSARIEGLAVDSQSHEPLWGLEGWASAGIFNAPHDPIFYSDAPLDDGGFGLKVRGGEDYWVGLDVAPHAPYVSGGVGPVPVSLSGHTFISVPLQHKDALIEGALVIAGTFPPEPALGVWAEIFGEDVTGQHWVVAGVDPDTAGYGLGVISGTWGLRAWVDPASGYVAMPTTTIVPVSSGGSVSVDFEVWPITSLISGTVRAPDGTPIEAFVFAEGESPHVGYFETQGWSDENGYFELLVPEGGYVVGAALPGDELEALGWLNPRPIDVPWVSAVSPSTGHELQFRRLDGAIHGTISFAPGINVTATHPAYVWGWANTGEWAETEAVLSGTDTFTYTLHVISDTVWHIGAVYEDWDGGFYYESLEAIVPVPPAPTPIAEVVQDLTLGGPWVLPQPIIVSFDGTQMQTIVLPDGLVLSIPPGALVDSGTVTLFIFPTQELRPEPGHEVIGAGYEIWAVDQNGKEITQFNKNIQVTFHYPDDASLAKLGVQEQLLIPAYYSTLVGHWILADSYAVDTVNNEITLQLSHFSKFGTLSTGDKEFSTYLPVVLRNSQ